MGRYLAARQKENGTVPPRQGTVPFAMAAFCKGAGHGYTPLKVEAGNRKGEPSGQNVFQTKTKTAVEIQVHCRFL